VRRLIYKLILGVNVLLVISLLLAYLSKMVSPQLIWHLTFFGLSYPYILVANLAMMIFWIVYRKKEFLLSLLFILLGWNIMVSVVQVNFNFLKGKNIKEQFTRKAREEESILKVLTYNVRAFNLYNWANNPEAKDSIFRYILCEDPDILCFQEYFTQERGIFTSGDLYKLLSKTPYRHIHYTMGENSNFRYGIATFSSYPIINKGVIRFENTFNTTIYSDVVVDEDTIRIFNNHLQSIHFSNRHYAILDSLKLPTGDKEFREWIDMSGRIRDASIKRSEQSDVIAEHIAESPYPVIICGDFNDTPCSYTYQRVKGNLKDSFVEAGTGLGNTYSGSLPSFRIDYILHSSFIRSIYNERAKIRLSDHYPVLSYLQLNQTEVY
jgi:endonuclease/exonuclease/phosphatase (EEP) superfamily protein YafD